MEKIWLWRKESVFKHTLDFYTLIKCGKYVLEKYRKNIVVIAAQFSIQRNYYNTFI